MHSCLATSTFASEGMGTFASRCAALGVLLWRVDERGMLASVVSPPAEAAGLFGSADLQQHVLAASRLDEKMPLSECVPGCVIAPIGRESGFTYVACAWTAMFVDGVYVAKACTELQIDLELLSISLLKSAHHSRRELESVFAALKWLFDDHVQRGRDRVTLDQFGEKLTQAYEEINMLFRMARMLNGVSDPCQLMELVCNQLQQTLPFQWVAVRFSDANRAVPALTGRLIVGGTLPIPAEEFDRHVAALAERWTRDDWTRLLLPRQHELARRMQSEIVADPIAHDDRIVGVLLAGNKVNNDADLSSAETQFVDAMADFLGVFHENLARFAEQRTLFMGTLRALTASIDAKDAYTRGHSERVALLAGQMASVMGLDHDTVELYRIAGLVHDVGKIGVPEAVLCKSARLSSSDFEFVRRHPQIGHDILKDIPLLQPVLPGVLHHHERFDGRGYPHGLAGQNIPLVARVLALADAFDAMSSNRAYRPARSRQQVTDEIRRCAGTQFDPALVDMFLAMDFSAFDHLLNQQRQQAKAA